MKPLTRFLVLLFFLSSIISCSNNDYSSVTPNPDVTFNAILNSASETPDNGSTAKGTAVLKFNSKTKIFTITVNYSGLTGPATLGHVHKGAVGVSGPPVFTFSNLTSPITYTSPVLDSGQEADLNANLYYVNIHSALNPGGEIRGQLIKY
ncbi:CHRD domain-containing protein [Flavobacterium psychrotolerans]|uniref:CHRD domain-containing protein n=1 Tax=Flavobacterium psychrotolerans TaxID=2169410 RepID=A0A2U1JHA7_9FLAO|nr:CHRD domain-containing protein [Flavobacterium psychrotolerans]PWA04389.1 CHRD domain-containing protein [Flavobacterium psychrotolerans]